MRSFAERQGCKVREGRQPLEPRAIEDPKTTRIQREIKPGKTAAMVQGEVENRTIRNQVGGVAVVEPHKIRLLRQVREPFAAHGQQGAPDEEVGWKRCTELAPFQQDGGISLEPAGPALPEIPASQPERGPHQQAIRKLERGSVALEQDVRRP